MKIQLILLSLLATLFATSLMAQSAPLKSEEIKQKACEYLSGLYTGNDEDWYEDPDLSKFGIALDQKICAKMDTHVSNVKSEKVGSKSFVTGLNLTLSNEFIRCQVKALRSISVKLDNNDKPIITKGKWDIFEVSDQSCYVKVAPEVRKAKIGDKGVKKISNKKLPKVVYVPDYLELGEPDDGAEGYEYESYVVSKNGKILGYIVDYWYANHEGEWATRYILKYNANGIMVGNLIEKIDMDYCEYPYYEEIPSRCEAE